MKTVKEEVCSLGERLSVNASLDDAMYELYVIDKIRKAQEQVRLGLTTDSVLLREEIEKW